MAVKQACFRSLIIGSITLLIADLFALYAGYPVGSRIDDWLRPFVLLAALLVLFFSFAFLSTHRHLAIRGFIVSGIELFISIAKPSIIYN